MRAFDAGFARCRARLDVVVKLDADVSFDADYFQQLLAAFARDPRLGIASGVCYELEGGRWTARHGTGDHVRGATRAYRTECLEHVCPLPEAVGWDGIDELKARVLGWRTARIGDLSFYHHRSVGERDGAPTRRWIAEGQCAHYMGYRLSYLVVRTLGRAVRDDLDPAVFAMLWGYAGAVASRRPRYDDEDVARVSPTPAERAAAAAAHARVVRAAVAMAVLDVVVVSYNSARELRRYVAPLAELDWVDAIVVDNQSSDGSLATIEDLPVQRIASGGNLGFSFGCNIGWRAGAAPAVLFLNPDAQHRRRSRCSAGGRARRRPLAGDRRALIRDADGSLDFSQRHFPRLALHLRAGLLPPPCPCRGRPGRTS